MGGAAIEAKILSEISAEILLELAIVGMTMGGAGDIDLSKNPEQFKLRERNIRRFLQFGDEIKPIREFSDLPTIPKK